MCQVVLFGVFGFNGLFDFDSLFRLNSLFCFGSLFFLFCGSFLSLGGSQILGKILLADYDGSFLYLHLGLCRVLGEALVYQRLERGGEEREDQKSAKRH